MTDSDGPVKAPPRTPPSARPGSQRVVHERRDETGGRARRAAVHVEAGQQLDDVDQRQLAAARDVPADLVDHLERFDDVDAVHLSIDLDVLPAAVAPGVQLGGRPESPDSPTVLLVATVPEQAGSPAYSRRVHDLVQRLLDSGRFDSVEVAEEAAEEAASATPPGRKQAVDLTDPTPTERVHRGPGGRLALSGRPMGDLVERTEPPPAPPPPPPG